MDLKSPGDRAHQVARQQRRHREKRLRAALCVVLPRKQRKRFRRTGLSATAFCVRMMTEIERGGSREVFSQSSTALVVLEAIAEAGGWRRDAGLAHFCDVGGVGVAGERR